MTLRVTCFTGKDVWILRMDIKNGLPKWTGMSGKSELIEDSPPEAVRKRKREIEERERKRNGMQRSRTPWR